MAYSGITVIKHGNTYEDNSAVILCANCDCVYHIENTNQVDTSIVMDKTEPGRAYTAIKCPECGFPNELGKQNHV